MTRSAELHHWLSLRHIPGLGPRAWRVLLQLFSDPAAILAADGAELAAVGVAPALVQRLRQGPDLAAVERDLRWLQGPDHHIVVLHDPRYPPCLREIPDAPLLLYACGDLRWLAHPQLAVVGSRNPTPDGKAHAHAFARALGGCGLAVTSGLALGIDGAAHRGALDAGAPTLAVLGHGPDRIPDRIYPAAHRALAMRIRARGLLVTELPPGTPPRAQHFPRRNRLISGLSLGVLVVEATPRSGSLITARLALEQNREVFAIPGALHNPQARGCHALIRQGAKLVECLQDILEELPPQRTGILRTNRTDTQHEAPPDRTALVQEDGRPREIQRLLAHLDAHTPVALDTLVERTGLTAERLSSMLLALELNQSVTALPGGLYLRRRRKDIS